MTALGEFTRRDFLRVSARSATLAGGWVLTGCGGATAPELPADVLALHRDCTVLDTHIDTLLWMRLLGYDIAQRHRNRLPNSPFAWHMDLPRAREGGLDAAVLGLVINPRVVADELMLPLKLLAAVERNSGIEQTLETLDVLAAATRARPDEIALCRSGSEIRAAIAAGRFAAMPGLEGSHGIESDLANVHRAYDRGLRMIGLTHFQASSAAYPMTVEAFRGRGLTDFGRDLVTEMEHLGIVVDLAHVNAAGVDDVLAMARRPLLISHGACRSLHDIPRNSTDEQIRSIADQGGVLALANGRSFMGGVGISRYVDHIEHVIRVGGEDAAAIGTDYDGAIIPVAGMPDVTSLPWVTFELLKRGHSDTVVRKLLGENALRVIEEVTG